MRFQSWKGTPMPSRLSGFMQRESTKRWVEYLIKAVVLLALFCLIACLGPTMPPICLAFLWSILSIASAIGVAYHYVINKARNRTGLEDGGVVARMNSGRFFSLTIAFVVSAMCVGGMMLELPKWELPEWAMLIAAIPLYIVIFLFMVKVLKKEFKPLLRVSRTVAASSAILFALLLIVYLVIILACPVAYYDSMTDAFLSAKQPFKDSPSTLLADMGYLTALVDGLTTFAMSRVSENSLAGYVAWRAALCASTALGISGLIGTCSLKLRELKLVFQPLTAADMLETTSKDDSIDATEDAPKPMKRYIVIACLLPAILVTCCVALDAKVTEAAKTDGYTMVRAAIREQVGMAACIIDGKRYDYEKVKGLHDKAQELSENLAAEREAALTPLINEIYDKRLENVDSYLDWYYSLPADYERLLQFFAGTVEDGMKEQLAKMINERVDETGLDETMNYYWEQSLKLESDIADDLARYELSDYGLEGIPEWLVIPAKELEPDFLAKPLEPTQKFLDASQRMGLSVGTGIVAGIIAKKATERILAKPFFKKIVASLLEKLAARGLLAIGGTAIAPGVGTAIGVGVGIAGDFLFLKADEAMNRDSYREEIISAIEESRTEMLELIRA